MLSIPTSEQIDYLVRKKFPSYSLRNFVKLRKASDYQDVIKLTSRSIAFQKELEKKSAGEIWLLYQKELKADLDREEQALESKKDLPPLSRPDHENTQPPQSCIQSNVPEITQSDALEKCDKPLTTRERETLLKLIFGLAIKGYGYDPSASKSRIITEIQGDLELLGISVSDDTVRDKLKQGAKIVNRSAIRNNTG